ncbi:MAG: 6-phosphofructokinase [Bacteroidales bacterium]|nr:6-phosphofructokinase [Bacteroidales bacterium]MCF8398691.1 6-phosphofructokinase [Bacteroidales bacterium]
MLKIKKIGVLTSGGDAPGMNAAVRAIVRTAIKNELEIFGIINGYQGLITGDFKKMDRTSVANILQRGGTMLKTARSEEFRTHAGRKKAHAELKRHKIDALVVIGGDGTFTGAKIFEEEFSFPMIGLPGTIDNDLFGTDFTIGFDTAINNVVQAVDKIRDTAAAHDRLFLVEVMGRDAGFIALRSGIAGGAEDILVPETKTYINSLIDKLKNDRRKNKKSGIVIVSEGDDFGGAYDVAEEIKKRFDHFDIRVTILGHIQRGGPPTCGDRVLASTLGYESVMALLKGKSGVMVGQVDNKIAFTPFEKAIKQHQKMNKHLLEIARVLSL